MSRRIRLQAVLAEKTDTPYVVIEIAGIVFVTKCNSDADAKHVAALVAKALGLSMDAPTMDAPI